MDLALGNSIDKKTNKKSKWIYKLPSNDEYRRTIALGIFKSECNALSNIVHRVLQLER